MTLTTRLYKVRTNLYPHLWKRSDAPAYSIKSYSLSHSWTPWWRVQWLKQCRLEIAAELQQRRFTNRPFAHQRRCKKSRRVGSSLTTTADQSSLAPLSSRVCRARTKISTNVFSLNQAAAARARRRRRKTDAVKLKTIFQRWQPVRSSGCVLGPRVWLQINRWTAVAAMLAAPGRVEIVA